MRVRLALLPVLALVCACSGLRRLPAVPSTETVLATLPGFDDVRYRPAVDLEPYREEMALSLERELAYRKARGDQGPLPPAAGLAISGGGDKGAFGAGLLNGWTAAGNRPEFKLVTGISTGALIAPFAFLGSAHDAELKRFYTNISPKDILVKRGILAAFTSDALADNGPLKKLVASLIDQPFLDAVAAEYEKGRLLMIGTADLDARQGVIWNMTKIAATRDPRALDLFRSVMIASASIPGAFPPAMLDVEVGGTTYQEMHVDGGTMAQVFVYPPSLKIRVEAEKEAHVDRERVLYIIRNSRLDPEWSSTERKTLNILGRAVSSLIQTQGIGDLYMIYATAERDGVDYNLAFIPPTFDVPHVEDFDTGYMRALYKVGYDLAAGGYPWAKVPPGYVK
jgi:Patatin-like phospholipase